MTIHPLTSVTFVIFRLWFFIVVISVRKTCSYRKEHNYFVIYQQKIRDTYYIACIFVSIKHIIQINRQL